MNTIRRRARKLIATAAAVAAISAGTVVATALPAAASETVTTDWVTVSDTQTTDFSMSLPIQKFDPALGDFQSIEIVTTSGWSTDYSFLNTAAQAQRMRISGNVTLLLSSPAASDFSSSASIAAFDTGFLLIPVGEPVEGRIENEVTLPTYTSSEAGWIGPGAVNVTYDSLTGTTTTGGGGNVVANQRTFGTLTVAYRYVYQTRDIATTPIAPTVTTGAACGVEETVVIPVQDGVAYTQVREGASVVVTAALAEGYALAPGAVAAWTLTIPAIVTCPVEVEEPPVGTGTVTPAGPLPLTPTPESASPASPAPAVAQTARATALAATGVEPQPLVLWGAGIAALGAVLLLARRRSSAS
ncbi:choice-of-anchor E domain-containing protein [Microbacterium sp. RU33B]|uniref:choice-of-anchor E domain-containing protein n=1 Tax=Microbacterium sp. RU33B TaxID=1907390 RepID=UPI000964FB34|nr:choice-of-anchor E domain-containing protein [Microbacterium sp. RU33B]SIT86183.1 hypothetical protein SAMN05880545_2473 [Microbacterium sp. RU33B]